MARLKGLVTHCLRHPRSLFHTPGRSLAPPPPLRPCPPGPRLRHPENTQVRMNGDQNGSILPP